ncbi:MAG TPA: hypothetical protein PLQ97_05115 [Myxococcota bacterium]|nr:hypothetical protein [Myxococcota bacterium]HQK51626.1 hypothetical protein [Myxococcota bacterium]
MPFRFSAEENAEVIRVLETRYGQHLRGEFFEVSGRMEPTFGEVIVTLANRQDTFRYRMEFRAALAENRLSQAEARDLLLDFVGYYLDQYFESGRDLLLPLDFQPYEMGEHVVYARGDVTNPTLDRMADEILDRGVPLEPGPGGSPRRRPERDSGEASRPEAPDGKH